MNFPQAKLIETNGVKLAVHEAGQGGIPVVLAHGWPELAYSWRYQVPKLVEKGYHVIAPDQRGYGDSDKPESVEAYDIHQLTADHAGLLDALGIDKAIYVGHDWGAIVVWNYALMYPDRFLRNLYRAGQWLEPEPGEGGGGSIIRYAEMDDHRGHLIMSEAELKVFVDAFKKGGFTAPCNWYRNFTRNWETTEHVEQKVRQPALMIYGEHDMVPKTDMSDYVHDLEVHTLDCGHWIQQERPEDTNSILLDWLERRMKPLY